MKGLSRDQIADLLATGQVPEGWRDLQRRAQDYVKARDTARREDAELASEVDATKATYDTARTVAELRRDALAEALPHLPKDSPLADNVVDTVGAMPDAHTSAAGSAQKQIEELREARREALAYAFRCDPLLHECIRALGDGHPTSGELREALRLFSG